MIEKLVSAIVAIALAAAAVWWFNDSIRDYYQKPLIEAHKKALKEQKEANSKAATVVQIKKSKGETVYVDRIKEIKVYAENLPKDAACLADAEFVRLHNSAKR
jgi:hypothetical protein